MAIPAIPAQGAPWLTYAQALDDEIRTGRLSDVGLTAAYVPKWKPNTAYAAGEAVVNPSGQLVTANSAFTSGASYVAGNWTAPAAGLSAAQIAADPTVQAAYGLDTRLLPAPPVTTKVTMLYNGLSNGTDTSTSFRTWYDVSQDCRDVRLVFINAGGTTTETVGPNPIKVKASIELTSNGTPSSTTGTLLPVYFGRDGRTATVNPGAILISDPIPVSVLKGKGFYCRTLVSVTTAGEKWPLGHWNDFGGSNSVDGVAANFDTTDGASNGGGAGGHTSVRLYQYGPVAIIGTPVNKTARTVAVFGNSIPAGTANAGNITDGSKAGYPSRAFLGKAGIINVAEPSEKATEFLVTTKYQTRMRLAQGCTDAFVDYINTQLYGDPGATFAIVTKAMQDFFTFLTARGFRIHVATCTPRTTSTDLWATTANQTQNSQTPLRNTVNAWVRAGCPTNGSGLAVTAGTAGAIPDPRVVSIHDLADAVESARDSGLWKPGYTGDGVHPNDVGGTAMAAAINTAAILA